MEYEFERRLAFEGAVNFRDIGGYPIGHARRMRWRRIFRSDNLGELSVADRERLSALKLRLLIDFRLPSERLQLPNRLPKDATFRTVEIGFVPEGTLEMFRGIRSGTIAERGDIEARVLEQYRRFPTDHNAQYKQAVDLIVDSENHPMLMHCTSGKDRTGFAVAIVLMSVGASKETILEDYVLTNRFVRNIAHLLSASTPTAVAVQLMSAQAKYLEAAFDQITRSYGSIDAYLERAFNLTDAKRSRLAELLTQEC